MLRDLPARARWYIVAVIAIGATTFVTLIPRATFTPLLPLVFLIALASLTSAFKVQFPIASGSNMSVSYVVDIAALILRGPHATMLVGAITAFSQTTLGAKGQNPVYRTLFNMAILVITIQVSGQVYESLGGTARPQLSAAIALPLIGMALTYFFCNTMPIAVAIGADHTAERVANLDVGSPRAHRASPRCDRRGGRHRGDRDRRLLADAAPHRGAALPDLQDVSGGQGDRGAPGRDSRSGARRDHDDGRAAEHPRVQSFGRGAMFGYSRMDILGRNVELLLPAADRAKHLRAFSEYLAHGSGASPTVSWR